MKNLTLLTDFYQLTMSNAYFKEDLNKEKLIFDEFIRKNPRDGG